MVAVWASVYFVPFIVLVFFIMLNVIVAVVLEGYKSCNMGRELDAAIEDYQDQWPGDGDDAHAPITLHTFGEFLKGLDGPLGKELMEAHGYPNDCTRQQTMEFARRVDAFLFEDDTVAIDD